MKNCTFCSNEAKLLFSHTTHDIGQLCLQCYLQFHGTCSVCSTSFLPIDVKPDINYKIKAKYIGLGDKKMILVCNSCHYAIRNEFPQMFG